MIAERRVKAITLDGNESLGMGLKFLIVGLSLGISLAALVEYLATGRGPVGQWLLPVAIVLAIIVAFLPSHAKEQGK